jgi:hypothetical protein
MEYEAVGLGRGAFEVIPKNDEAEFVAELGIGSALPVIGPSVDVVLRVFFSRRLETMRQHMREEGENLKKIIESGARVT